MDPGVGNSDGSSTLLPRKASSSANAQAFSLEAFDPVTAAVAGRIHGDDSALRRVCRRVAGLVLASGLLVLVAPLMGVIAVILSLQGSGMVLHRQTRVGYRGRRFRMLKFRTLDCAAERKTAAVIAALGRGDLTVGDAVAILKVEGSSSGTRFGRWLRRTSLDELPQLWHVLTGDMGLVGPRPLRPFEVEGLHGWQLARHDVRPGITGLWQVMGRSDIRWEVRMQLDYLYVCRRSLALDLRILARTPGAVLRREGAR